MYFDHVKDDLAEEFKKFSIRNSIIVKHRPYGFGVSIEPGMYLFVDWKCEQIKTGKFSKVPYFLFDCIFEWE